MFEAPRLFGHSSHYPSAAQLEESRSRSRNERPLYENVQTKGRVEISRKSERVITFGRLLGGDFTVMACEIHSRSGTIKFF